MHLVSSPLQPPLQAVPLQTLPLHETGVTVGQVVPEQMPAGVAVPAVQLGAEHCVPEGAATWWTPVVGSQLSVVQMLPSSVGVAEPETHEPVTHLSPVVQALPSLQPVPSVLFGFEHTPFAVLHVPAL